MAEQEIKKKHIIQLGYQLIACKSNYWYLPYTVLALSEIVSLLRFIVMIVNTGLNTHIHIRTYIYIYI
jgi:hypothetical protein